MDLIEILRKKVKEGDVMDDERRRLLSRGLSSLNPSQAENAYKIIIGYKEKYETTRYVGETSSSIPYYGQKINEYDITFTMCNGSGNIIPDQLQLILEQLIESNNRR